MDKEDKECKKKKIIRKNRPTHKVIFLNTQGYKNKRDKIKKLLSEYKPTVFVIAEHFQYSEESLDSIPGYTLASSYFRASRERGGVAVYVRSDVEFILRSDLDEGCLKYDFEMVSVEIPSLKLVVTGVYKNSCRNKKLFYNKLDNILGLYDKEPDKIHMMTGDFNIDFSTNIKAKKILNDHDYKYQLACSTSDYGSCLDNFIVDFIPLKARVLRIIDEISDHRPIELILPRISPGVQHFSSDSSSDEESSEDDEISSDNTSDSDSDDSSCEANSDVDKRSSSDDDSDYGQAASTAFSRTPNDAASEFNMYKSRFGNPKKPDNKEVSTDDSSDNESSPLPGMPKSPGNNGFESALLMVTGLGLAAAFILGDSSLLTKGKFF